MSDTERPLDAADFRPDMSAEQVRAAEPEYFHRLVNIEDHPEFLETANLLARHYLDEGARNEERAAPGSNLKRLASYDDDLFEARMHKIYDGYAATMNEPHWLDSGVLTFPDERGRARRYPIGRVSDNVVRDRLVQMAPFNLVDGSWLRNIQEVGPSDEVRSVLFAIYEDETGNGDASHNHPNVYDALLKSLNVYLPPITSRAFIQHGFLPGAFTGAVFQLAVGQFPQQFFPELLGMTLYLEWESSPTMTPMERVLRSRRMNPLFFQLHVAIDNISAGHGALAIQAIQTFLAQEREEGGDASIDTSWRRIWNGYVTWATLGGLGRELVEHALITERKQINLSSDPGKQVCWPDLAAHARQRMLALVEHKAPIARKMHGGKVIGGRSLSSLFDDPPQLLDVLVSAGLVDPDRARDSRLVALMDFEGPMFEVFTDAEKDVVLDWVESLRSSGGTCVDPLPPRPLASDLPGRVADLIRDKAPVATRLHAGLTLSDGSGPAVPLRDLFGDPPRLMRALVASGWVVPGHQDRSIFLSRVVGSGGPMSGAFSPDEVRLLLDWVERGAAAPEPTPPPEPQAPPQAPASATDAAPLVEPAAEASDTELRHLTGMGAVH